MASFLGILKEYFTKLESKDVLVGTKQDIEIPFEWLFTEKMDRAIIQKTLVNIFERNDPTYRKGAEFRGNNPDVIENIFFQISRNTEKVSLMVLGANKWSKLIISEKQIPNLRAPQLTEEEFIKEITRVLNDGREIAVLNANLNLSEESMQYVQSAFAEILNSPVIRQDTDRAMCDLATNLVEYYKYLVDLKENSQGVYYGEDIKRRTDRGALKTRIGNVREERKSEIYPFIQRDAIFQHLNPEYKVINGNIGEGGKVEKNAFTTYVYKNPRGKKGYLFVSEPLEGLHETRMFYIPQEKMDEQGLTGDIEKIKEKIEDYLSMSNEEFYNERFTRTFRHRGFENFRQRMRYMVTGEVSPIIKKHIHKYEKYDEQLFEGKVVTHDDIKDLVISRDLSDISDLPFFFGENTQTKEEE